VNLLKTFIKLIILKASEEEKRNKSGFVGGKKITPTEDVLTVLYRLFLMLL
jgi:hypothetical protein